MDALSSRLERLTNLSKVGGEIKGPVESLTERSIFRKGLPDAARVLEAAVLFVILSLGGRFWLPLP